MNEDSLEELLAALSQKSEKSYRVRLDNDRPEVHNSIATQAMEMVNFCKDHKDPVEIAEYIRKDNMCVIEALHGSLNALEHITQGEIGSRPSGPCPINVLGAFVYWLFDNPEVLESFRESSLFQTLCDSAYDGFNWE